MFKRTAALLFLAACGSSGPGSPTPGAMTLAYTMPATNPITYEIADTTFVSMDVMGQSVQVQGGAHGTLSVDFSRAGDKLGTTVSYLTLAGEFTNSMGPSMQLTAADVPGPARLEVDRRGAITMTEKPELTATLRQILGSESMYRRLFVRLPGGAARPGMTWTDTIMTDDDAGNMQMRTHEVVTSTLVGDTAVDGRSLLQIRSSSTSRTDISGENQGFEFRQVLTGTSTSVTLWDPERRVLFERIETGTSAGSMDLPAAGITGVPVSATAKQVLRLRGS